MHAIARAGAFALAMSWPGLASPQDWPQFRGPGGQGHSSETGLVNAFSETKNVVWKTPVPGLGWSSPVVSGGKVWLTAATGDREVSLRASRL